MKGVMIFATCWRRGGYLYITFISMSTGSRRKTYRRRSNLLPSIPIPGTFLLGSTRIFPLEHLIMIIPTRMRRAHFPSSKEPLVPLKRCRFGEEFMVECAGERMRNGRSVESDCREDGVGHWCSILWDPSREVDYLLGRASRGRGALLMRRQTCHKVLLLHRIDFPPFPPRIGARLHLILASRVIDTHYLVTCRRGLDPFRHAAHADSARQQQFRGSRDIVSRLCQRSCVLRLSVCCGMKKGFESSKRGLARHGDRRSAVKGTGRSVFVRFIMFQLLFHPDRISSRAHLGPCRSPGAT